MIINKKQLFTLTLILLGCIVSAQNIETVLKAKPLKLTGHIGLGGSYHSDSRYHFDNRFGYRADMGLTLSIYETFKIPISFTYSDQQTTFNRPTFNRFGISPSYKWVTVHAGYHNYTISPYLVSGSSILGGGIELKPGAFRLSFFYGNLTHKFNVGFNHADISGKEIEFYKRKAIGGKIGFEFKGNYIHFSVFKAKDDSLSGDFLLLDSLSIRPKENIGAGVHIGFDFWNTVNFKTNFTSSLMNEDATSRNLNIDDRYKKLTNIMPINESTRNAFAYDATLSFRFNQTNIGFKYQHIDPNYQSLGIVYIQPDFDNYTVNLSTSFFKSKVLFYGSFGLQFNNTKNYLDKREKRTIINAGLNWKILKNLTTSVNYNNYNSNNGLQVTEILDTFRIIADNQGLNATLNYNFGPKGNKNSINFSYSKNTFNLVQGESIISKNNSSNINLSYSKKIKKSGWTLGANIKQSVFGDVGGQSVKRFGGGLKIKKKIGKKIKLGLSPSYNINFSNGIRDGNVIKFRFRASYKINNKNALNFTTSYRRRQTTIITPYDQFRGSLQYSINF